MSARSIRRAHQREAERRRRRGPFSKAATAAGAALGATALVAPAADAATFTVTSLADTDETAGTLREEIEDANQTAGADTIVFDAALSGTITLTGASGGDIEVYYDSLEIRDPGPNHITVAGDGSDRLFELFDFNDTADEVEFYGLTLTGGKTSQAGGAIATDLDTHGVGLYAADVTIANSVVTGNEADDSGGAFYSFYGGLTVTNSEITNNATKSRGGGVYLYGANDDESEAQAILIEDSEISGNTADGYGGGFYSNRGRGDLVVDNTKISGNTSGQGQGAGGFSTQNLYGNVSITDSTISGNRSGDYAGGARFYTGHGSVLVEDSTFSGNISAEGAGGALFYGNDGALTVRRSTFSGNRANYSGGGMTIWRNDGAVVVENSTFSGNQAEANENGFGRGGGLYSYNRTDNARTIRNTTITGNSADDGGGIGSNAFDSGTYAGDDVIGVSSTIVHGNTADGQGPDVYNSSTGTGDGFTLGFSLVGSLSGASVIESPASSNKIGVDPQLNGLADAGGPTETHVPSATSPALDSGVPNGLTTDQRGLARTVDLGVANAAGSDGTDIGSVERSATEDTQTSIDSGPANGSSTNDTTPTFTFSSEDASPTFECSLVLEGVADSFGACSGAGTHTPSPLAPGTYVFKVRATSGGNVDDTPATRTFTVDTTAPQTTITSGPGEGSTTTDSTPTFGFSSSEPGSTFECSIDGGSFLPCTGPGRTHTSGVLADGAHTFRVRAIDSAGNVDLTAAERNFTVADPPETFINSGPGDGSTTDDRTPSFTFSADEANSTFECSLVEEGQAPSFVPCTSPFTPAAPLADGTYVFSVRATDPSSNVDPSPAQITFTVSAPPETTIDSGPADGSTIDDPQPTFGFSSDEPGSTFQCSLDTGTPSFAPCSGPGASHTPAAPLTDGTYFFRVRAVDPDNDIDQTPAQRTFTVAAFVPPPIATCQGKEVVRQEGTSGDDVFPGTGLTDAIFGLAGDDTLKGKGGRDCLNGGAGKDTLSGGSGKDKLKGGGGKDTFKTGGGKDSVNCGGGNDKVTADPKDKISQNCEKVVERG